MVVVSWKAGWVWKLLDGFMVRDMEAAGRPDAIEETHEDHQTPKRVVQQPVWCPWVLKIADRAQEWEVDCVDEDDEEIGP